jgi:tetratricopeptide (TPR) repeat protein
MLANRGLYLAAHGRHERAIEYFNRSLSLDPGYTPARQGLNESLKALRGPQPAKSQ